MGMPGWTIRRGMGLLLTTAIVWLGAGVLPTSGQMTEREADTRVHSIALKIDRVRLKRVLMADRATLGRYITGSDPGLARYAIEEAVKRRDHAGVAALVKRTQDLRDAGLSAAAASALGRLGGSAALAGLRGALRDRRPQVRAAAAVALGPYGERGAVPGLREALDQPDPQMRVAAASYLAKLGDRSSAPRVRRLVNKLDPAARRRLCRALGTFGDPGSRRKLEQMLAREEYSGTRAHAARALAIRPHRSSVPALIAALKDPSPDVRYEAALALHVLRDPRAVRALQIAAQQPSPNAANAPGMDAKARKAAAGAAAALGR